MIYDCYAVSNHFGNLGMGHYTAFCRSPVSNTWYEFDDSSVREVNPSRLEETIVTGAAYNLFYRRRDWHENNIKEMNFDKLAIKPDMQYIEANKK